MAEISKDSIVLEILLKTNQLKKGKKEVEDLAKSAEKPKKSFKDLGEVADQVGEKIEESFKESKKAIEESNVPLSSFSDRLKGAAKDITIFGINIGDAVTKLNNKKTALLSVIKGLGSGSKALNLFKVALIGTGIGAIVIALGSMVVALTKSQKGVDFVSKAMAGLGTAVDVVFDRIIKFGGGVIKLFTGDMAGAVEDFKGTFSGLGDEILKESQAAFKLEERAQNLRDAQRDLNVEYAKSIANIERLREKARDESLSQAERQKAVQDAIKLENELEVKRIKNAEENFAIIKEQNALNESLVDDLDAQAEAEIAIANIRAETATKRRRDNQLLQQIEREGRAKRAKQRAEEAKEEAEMLKKVEAARIIIEKLKTSLLKNEFEKRKKVLELEQEAAIKALFGTPQQISEQADLIRAKIQQELDLLEKEIAERNIQIELGETSELPDIDIPLKIDSDTAELERTKEVLNEIKEAGKEASEESIKKLNDELERLKKLRKDFDAFDELLEKILGDPELVKDLKAAVSGVFNLVKEITVESNKEQIEALEKSISLEKGKLSELKSAKDQANAEEIERQEELINAKEIQLEREVEAREKAAKRIAIAEQSVLLVQAIVVALDTIKKAKNPFVAIAALAALTGSILKFKSAISGAAPTLHEGTESIGDRPHRLTGGKLRPDEMMIKAQKKERVLSVAQNAPLLAAGIMNDDIPHLVMAGLKARNNPIPFVTIKAKPVPTMRLTDTYKNIPGQSRELKEMVKTNKQIVKQNERIIKRLEADKTFVDINEKGIAVITQKIAKKAARRRK